MSAYNSALQCCRALFIYSQHTFKCKCLLWIFWSIFVLTPLILSSCLLFLLDLFFHILTFNITPSSQYSITNPVIWWSQKWSMVFRTTWMLWCLLLRDIIITVISRCATNSHQCRCFQFSCSSVFMDLFFLCVELVKLLCRKCSTS